jgi:hypothetical protein
MRRRYIYAGLSRSFLTKPDGVGAAHLSGFAHSEIKAGYIG